MPHRLSLTLNLSPNSPTSPYGCYQTTGSWPTAGPPPHLSPVGTPLDTDQRENQGAFTAPLLPSGIPAKISIRPGFALLVSVISVKHAPASAYPCSMLSRSLASTLCITMPLVLSYPDHPASNFATGSFLLAITILFVPPDPTQDHSQLTT